MRRKTAILLFLILGLISLGHLVKAGVLHVPTGTWASGGAVAQPRAGASAAPLQDGRVLITGGDIGTGPTATADFVANDGSTSAAPLMGAPRSSHISVVLQDGRVLVVGGFTSGGVANSAEIFDPALNSWSGVAGGMVEARAGAGAVVLNDGRVLITGGQGYSGTAKQSAEIFDPASGAFSFFGTLSSARKSHAAALLSDGRVLIVGGSDANNNVLATSDIYDPLTGTISAGPSLSTPRQGLSATTLLDGRVLVAGGNNTVVNPDGSSSSVDLSSAEILDAGATAFSTSASALLTARSGHQAFLLPYNNSVLIVGGTSSGTAIASAELYIPWGGTSQSGMFQATTSMSTARSTATGSALQQDGVLLVAGGKDASGAALSSSDLYGFATVKTDAADYPPGTTVNITGSGWKPGETVTLTLVESPLIDTHGPFTTVADANGNISNSSVATDTHDVNVRFYLTAVGSQSQAQNTFTDAKAVPTTTITSHTPNPSVFGQAITFNVSVTSTSTVSEGCVHIEDSGTTVSGLVQVVSGAASVSVSTLAVGTHSSLTAVYTDTGNGCTNGNTFSGSTSAVVSQTVNAANTSTVLGSSANPSVFGQSVTFTATVSDASTGSTGTPTGTVTFKDGATTLGTGTLSSG